MVTIREYVNAKFKSLEKDLDDLHQIVIDHLRDVADIVRRREYDQKHEELVRRMEAIENRLANMMGRLIIFAILGTIAVAVMGAFLGHLFK